MPVLVKSEAAGRFGRAYRGRFRGRVAGPAPVPERGIG